MIERTCTFSVTIRSDTFDDTAEEAKLELIAEYEEIITEALNEGQKIAYLDVMVTDEIVEDDA